MSHNSVGQIRSSSRVVQKDSWSKLTWILERTTQRIPADLGGEVEDGMWNARTGGISLSPIFVFFVIFVFQDERMDATQADARSCRASMQRDPTLRLRCFAAPLRPQRLCGSIVPLHPDRRLTKSTRARMRAGGPHHTDARPAGVVSYGPMLRAR